MWLEYWIDLSFFLHCPIFQNKWHTLLSTLNNIDSKISESTDSYLIQTLLSGCTWFDSETNSLVFNTTIDYVLSPERFEGPLFSKNLVFHMQLFDPFKTSCGLFNLSVFSFTIFFCFASFCIPRWDCDFLVYCVISYINIYINNTYIHIHIYIYIFIFTHTHTHTHIYIYM